MKAVSRKSLFFGLCVVSFFAVLTLPGHADQMGFGLNYGYINNFSLFSGNSSEAGSVLQVSYLFKKNNFYTLALEIGFIADNNVFKYAAVPTYTQTACYLNIKNIFRLPKLLQTQPYVAVGTAINGVNSWRKEGNSFYITANNIFADINLGGGIDFQLLGLLGNLDLNFPAVLHTYYTTAKVPIIVSFGFKKYLEDE